MRVGGGVRVRCKEIQAIVESDEKRDDDALGDLDAVDARQHVDALRAKHGDTCHVEVVDRAEVEQLTKVRLQLDRDNDACYVKVDKVDHQDGNGSQSRNPPLVAPADIEEIVTDAEEGDCLQRDDCA